MTLVEYIFNGIEVFLREKHAYYHWHYYFNYGSFMALVGKTSNRKASGRYYYRKTRFQIIYTDYDHDPHQYCIVIDSVDFSKIEKEFIRYWFLIPSLFNAFYIFKENNGRR